MSGTTSSGPSIQFQNFPASTWRPHGVYAEIHAAPSNQGPQAQRAIIFGQVVTGGTAVAGVPIQAFSQKQIDALSGSPGSMLSLMYAAYLRQDPFGEVWVMPLVDDPAAVAGTGTLVCTGPATATGMLPLWIAGQPVYVGVTSGDASTAIATNIAAKINGTLNLPCTASVTASTVTVTALNKGLAENDIDMRLAYLGATAGEAVPAGVTVTVTALAGGATNPVLTTALTNMADMPFDCIVSPYTDSISLTALQSFLSETSGRWAPISQIYGHVFAAARGTAGTLTTLGTGRNNDHESILGFYDSPTPAWLEAADFAAACFRSLKVDPGLPMQELALNLLAPPIASRFTKATANTFLWDGISTFYVQPDGTCRLDRVITTYQLNASGQPDDSYLDVETMFGLMFYARYNIAALSNAFSRKKLVADGTRVPAGSNMASPSTVKDAAVAIYRFLETAGYVQQSAQFAANAQAQLGTQKGQVLLLLPVVLVGQLRQIAMNIQFSKT